MCVIKSAPVLPNDLYQGLVFRFVAGEDKNIRVESCEIKMAADGPGARARQFDLKGDAGLEFLPRDYHLLSV